MPRLRGADLLALLGLVQELEAIDSLEAFPSRALAGLGRLVPGEILTYNEIDPRRHRARWSVDPPAALTAEHHPVFEQFLHQHPLIRHYWRTGDGRALAISDFLSPAAFHRLELYDAFYRPLGVEDQLAVTLPSRPELVIGLAFNRGRRDFSERERLLLDLLRPHLVQAHRRAEARTELELTLRAYEQALEEGGRAVVLLGARSQIRMATGRARRCLAAYFGPRAQLAERLPEAVERWLQRQRDHLRAEAAVTAPRAALVVDGPGGRLLIQYVPGGEQGSPEFLLLEERRTVAAAEAVGGWSLTGREAEVLARVAQGTTDREVAERLGVSPRTVDKHLEHIREKLGVPSRTAAVARVLQTAAADLGSPRGG